MHLDPLNDPRAADVALLTGIRQESGAARTRAHVATRHGEVILGAFKADGAGGPAAHGRLVDVTLANVELCQREWQNVLSLNCRSVTGWRRRRWWLSRARGHSLRTAATTATAAATANATTAATAVAAANAQPFVLGHWMVLVLLLGLRGMGWQLRCC